ncbi:MFS transporter [Embleya scabrispora]|uniref:MFS transporter n=1 Tax=Embleya scabrispora TaxID=159449 RepID=A0A1T3NS57_9ACTN|nr:MFS transporter [Embleya scabrispora]OPC79512.1 MFS transporter [Embleya scabrispora]
MALACGVSVANVYFPQALGPLVADGLDLTPGAAAAVATLTQLGYALGIFLLVPLGDRLPRRPLITTLLAVTACALLVAGLAPAFGVLLAAGTAVGIATVVPQVLLPMAAGLVAPEHRGRIIGTLQGGLIGGILLARTFGGIAGEHLGWRAPYLIAAALTALLAVVLARALPATTASGHERYPTLLADTLRMLRTEPALRRSALYQAILFGAFSAVWTALALLITGPRYDLDTQTVGLLALIGAAGMFYAPAAGRLVDHHGPARVNLACALATLAAASILTLGTLAGIIGLTALAVGLLLLDVAIQCGQVANQARIFALRPEARSRLNTAYMTCSFLGGSAGSWLGVHTYTRLGWPGVCTLAALAAAIVLAIHIASHRPGRNRAPAKPPAPQPTTATR